MKILNDHSLFLNLNPRLYASSGESRYYITEHIAPGRVTVLRKRATHELLCGGLLFRNFKMLKLNHHRRKKQQGFLCIILVQAGNLYFHQDDSVFLAEKGDAILTLSGTDSEYRTGDARFADVSMLLMKGSLLEPFCSETNWRQKPVFPILEFSKLKNLFQEEESCMRGQEATSESETLVCFRILELLRNAAKDAEEWSIPQQMDQYLRLHLSEKLDLNQLSEVFKTGKSGLNKRFLRFYHQSPHAYITRLRIEAAKDLLRNKMLSIKEISNLLGYENALNFSTRFRKQTGMSPNAYRQKNVFSGQSF